MKLYLVLTTCLVTMIASNLFAADASKPDITKELNEIQKQQKEILQKLDEIKQDISVVKLRATR